MHPDIKKDKEMFVITASCWQCKKPMLVALIGSKSGDLICGPEAFSDSEKRLAEQSGVCLKLVSSKTAEEIYLANVCRECNFFVGKWYLFANYLAEALYGRLNYKIVR